MKPLILVLVGPTGTGKTELAIRLAKKFPIEVISADSMQLYQGLDIGTAKPTRTEQRRVKHHLIDLVPPSKNFSVYLFRKKALVAIQNILKRGRTPVVVGGSGLYVRALLNGLTQYPKSVRGLRAKLEKDFKREGVSALYRRLKSLNGSYAEGIDPQNPRRVIRALEIALSAKSTASGKTTELSSLKELGYEVKVLGISMERNKLYEQVEKRIDQMFRKGWLAEAKRLSKKRLSRTVKQAVGYRQIWESGLLARGTTKREEFKSVSDSVKLATRHLVKKQFTWYRREPWIEWFDVTSPEGFRHAEIKIGEELNRINLGRTG